MIYSEGRLWGLIVIITSMVLTYYFIGQAKKGNVRQIRHISGLDALDEAVGRAAEMGRPVHFTAGAASMISADATQMMAGFAVLDYLIGKTTEKGVRIITSIARADTLPIAEDIVRTAFAKSAHPENFDEKDLVYHGEREAYRAGILGLIHRENVGANILMGSFYAESIVFGEAGANVGAMQIAGTANIHQMPFLISTCDYCLLGEELFAAGAFLSGDQEQISTISGQDVIKVISVVLVIVGALLSTAGIDILSNILGM